MVENGLIDRKSAETQIVFETVYQTHFESRDGAADLFDKMMRAFSVTLSDLAKDSVIFALTQASHKEISTRLDHVDQALRSHAPSGNENICTAEEYQAAVLKIARALQQSYKTVRVETNRGPRDVEINKIYVPPKLSIRQTKESQSRLERMLDAIRTTTKEGRRINEYSMRQESHNYSILDYAELTDSFKRIVVLGDPGGGKSTLCQKICYDMAKNTALAVQFKENSYIPIGLQRLPIRVILRKYEQARATTPQLDILTYIARDVVNYANEDEFEIKRHIKQSLIEGHVVLAFDGLDEILDTSMRQEYVDLVDAFCNQFPLCPVIVTSRFVGYDDAPLPKDFEEVVLQRFDDDEVKSYLTKFMRVVGSKSQSDALLQAQEFLKQTADSAPDLRRNPLMLGLMGWLFLSSGDVPSNRPEIYKECAILMFERWDQRRGIIADETNDFDRSQLFIKLAAQIYGVPKLAGGVTKEWLEASLENTFVHLYENKARAFRAARDFVRFITGRAWVMTEIGDKIFAFTHQTFLEYFFARFLDDKYDSVTALLKALKPRIVKREWNEVTHLALQLKTHRSIRKQEEALGLLQSFVSASRLPKQQSALMEFGAKALEYLSPPESKVGAFLEVLFTIGFDRAARGEQGSLSFVSLAVVSARERKNFVVDRVGSVLKHAILNGPSVAVQSSASDLLWGREPDIYRRDGRIIRSILLPTDLVARLRKALRQDVLLRADESPFFAGLALSWYGDINLDRIKKFGLLFVANSNILRELEGLNGLAGLTILASGKFVSPRLEPIITEQKAREILELVGLAGAPFVGATPADEESRGYHGTPPPTIWQQCYDALEGNEPAQFGAIISRLVSLPLRHPRIYGGERREWNKLVAREEQLLARMDGPTKVSAALVMKIMNERS
jgi:hypothetical protein